MAVQLALRAGADVSSVEVAAKCLSVDAAATTSTSVVSAADDAGNRVEYTNAVLRFLAAKSLTETKGANSLYGNSADGGQAQAKAEIDSWLDFCQKEISKQLEQAGGSTGSSFAFKSQCLSVLETHLKSRSFLVGSSVSLADISVACELAESCLQDAAFAPEDVFLSTDASAGKSGYPGLSAWYSRVLQSEGAAAMADTMVLVHDTYAAKVKELKGQKVAKDDPQLKAALSKLLKLKKLGGVAAAGAKKDFKPDDRKADAGAGKAGAGGSLGSIKEDAEAAPAAPADPEKEAKKAAKKAEKERKEAEKAAKKAAMEAEQRAAREAKMGPKLEFTADFFEQAAFGRVFIQSQAVTGRKFFDLSELGKEATKDMHSGKQVWLRCRMHNQRMPFYEFRQNLFTIQAMTDKNTVGAELVKFAGQLPNESVLDVLGTLVTPPTPIQSCSIHNYELQVEKIYSISRADKMAFQIVDASRSEAEILEGDKKHAADIKAGKSEKEAANKYPRVTLDTRLNNRVLDLRTVTNQAILRLQSGVCTFFRQYLLDKNFVEIHSPKMIAQASEGGAEVFEVKYFPKYGLDTAYLAQSPQLYKQMALMGDLPRVFEIGPVFRSEDSFTHRHMTEFVGLDMEMSFNEHYHECLDVLDECFFYIFDNLNKTMKTEIEAVRKQFPFKDLKYSFPCQRFTFKEAVELLKTKGPKYAQDIIDRKKAELDMKKSEGIGSEKEFSDMMDFIEKALEHKATLAGHAVDEDLSTKDEKVLGELVHHEFDTDFYIVDKFPDAVRPFYTMPDPVDPMWSNSYDIFIRGEEIMSGAQRIHDPELLFSRAAEKGVDLSPIKEYVDSFSLGAWPHAGGGVGLERVVMLFLGLDNIRRSSLFPRDPKRLTP